MDPIVGLRQLACTAGISWVILPEIGRPKIYRVTAVLNFYIFLLVGYNRVAGILRSGWVAIPLSLLRLVWCLAWAVGWLDIYFYVLYVGGLLRSWAWSWLYTCGFPLFCLVAVKLKESGHCIHDVFSTRGDYTGGWSRQQRRTLAKIKNTEIFLLVGWSVKILLPVKNQHPGYPRNVWKASLQGQGLVQAGATECWLWWAENNCRWIFCLAFPLVGTK